MTAATIKTAPKTRTVCQLSGVVVDRPSKLFDVLETLDTAIDWRERAERAECRVQELEAEVAALRVSAK